MLFSTWISSAIRTGAAVPSAAASVGAAGSTPEAAAASEAMDAMNGFMVGSSRCGDATIVHATPAAAGKDVREL